MENRFSLKDLFLFLLLGVLIVLVLLGWKQYDRQWDLVRQTSQKLNEQTTDLARIRSLLERGVAVAGTQPGGGAAAGDASAADADVDARRIHAAPDFAPGDQVVDVFGQIPDRLTPLVSTDLYSSRVQEYVLDTLCERDPKTFGWRPRLAKSWKVSPDGLTIDFELRRGVTFSNGDPLTADDVAFTLDWTMNEKVEAPRTRSYLDQLVKCERTGEFGVRFHFKESYFKSFEMAALTQVMSRKFYSRFTPEQFNTSTGLLIGSGPYRLPDPEGWRPEPGKPIVLVRNERYWGEPAGPDRVVWRLIENPAAAMTAFRNGETDVYYNMTPTQYEDMRADPKLSARARQYALEIVNSGYFYIGWNQARDGKPTRFADPRVRRALTMLLDRDMLVKQVMKGLAVPVSGPFNRLSPQYDPSVQPLPYDPEAAKKLLAEAGYTLKDGVLVGADGQPFRFQLMHGATREVGKRIASYAKDALARAGILVDTAPSEWSVMLDRTKERKFDAILMAWGGVIEDDPNQIFHSKAMAGVGDNFVQYSNPKLDAAIDKARQTMDDAARMKLWHEVHRIIAEDQPYTFLLADFELWGVNNRFKGVEATKVGLNSRNEWYVPVAARQQQPR